MMNADNVKFPKAVKNMRYRFSGAGQLSSANLQWYVARHGEIFGPSTRVIAIKSTLKDGQSKPYCLVDSNPKGSTDTRSLVTQPCPEALDFNDGREIWVSNM